MIFQRRHGKKRAKSAANPVCLNEASLVGSISAAVLASVGLEVLVLGSFDEQSLVDDEPHI